MLEIKITFEAPELSASINNLAGALAGKAEPAEKAEPLNPVTVTLPSFVPTGDGPVYTDTPIPPRSTVPVPAVPVAPVVPTAPAVPAVPTAPAVSAVPTAAPQYDLDTISRAGNALLDGGQMEQLLALLKKYGIDNLTKLPKEQYAAMAADLRALGAQI